MTTLTNTQYTHESLVPVQIGHYSNIVVMVFKAGVFVTTYLPALSQLNGVSGCHRGDL